MFRCCCSLTCLLFLSFHHVLGFFVWPKDHGHIASVLLGHDFDLADIDYLCCYSVKDASPKFWVLHLSASKHDRYFDFVALS